MAQTDFINYFSILFWFYIIFIIYYLINYSFLLPSIYSTLVTRSFIYKEFLILMKSKFSCYIKDFGNFFYIRKNFIILILILKKNLYVF